MCAAASSAPPATHPHGPVDHRTSPAARSRQAHHHTTNLQSPAVATMSHPAIASTQRTCSQTHRCFMGLSCLAAKQLAGSFCIPSCNQPLPYLHAWLCTHHPPIRPDTSGSIRARMSNPQTLRTCTYSSHCRPRSQLYSATDTHVCFPQATTSHPLAAASVAQDSCTPASPCGQPPSNRPGWTLRRLLEGLVLLLESPLCRHSHKRPPTGHCWPRAAHHRYQVGQALPRLIRECREVQMGPST
jgi:hypothetical protein